MSTLEPKSITRTVLRRRSFDARTIDDVFTVVRRLLTERHTGPIIINASQGGLLGVSAEDSAKLPEPN